MEIFSYFVSKYVNCDEVASQNIVKKVFSKFVTFSVIMMSFVRCMLLRMFTRFFFGVELDKVVSHYVEKFICDHRTPLRNRITISKAFAVIETRVWL